MISSREFDAYNSAVASLADEAERIVTKDVLAWCEVNPGASVSDCRAYAIESMRGMLPVYDEAAAAIAADWYDERALSSGKSLKPAVTATTYDDGQVERTARLQARKLEDGDIEAFAASCGELARNDAMRSLNETMRANCRRDEPEGVMFARVPTGWETCTFCLRLASYGAIYASRKAAGEFNHYHRRCDCKVVPCFDGDPMAELVEGRKPATAAAYLRLFEEIDAIADVPKLTKSAMKRQVLLSQADRLDGSVEELVPWGAVVQRFYVPDRKIEEYSLSYTGDKDKTLAFRLALGFTPADAAELVRQIFAWVSANKPAYKSSDGYGERYETIMQAAGKDGKVANVLAAWILPFGDDKLRLVSCYVDREKGARK